MPKLVVSIPKLGLTPKADDSRELYIIAFASDLNITENKEKEVLGAMNVTLPTVVPELATQDAMKFMLASVSNVFPVSRIRPHANLFGSGIMLYPNLDPKGFLALQIFLIESDDNHRRLGDKLSRILGGELVKKAVDGAIGTISNTAIAGVMNALGEVVPKVFKDSKDDLLATASYSGFDYDNYGLNPDEKMAEFSFQDRKGLVEATVRIRIND